MKKQSLLLCSLLLILVALAAVSLGGCSGGSSSPAAESPAAPDGGGRGTTTITIRWPEPGRLIPRAAQSVRLVLNDNNGQSLANQVVPHPPAGQNTSTVSLSDLPAGPVTFTATAHPVPDGNGVPQARGVFAATIVAGQSVPVTLTMDSTITSVLLTPPSPSVTRGQGLNLAASAQDASGAVVLTANENWVWESSNPLIAAIGSASGGQAALDARLSGIVTVTARETESGRTAQVSVTVLGPPVAQSRLAFIRIFNNFWEVHTVNADGSNVQRLTTDTGIGGGDPLSGSRPSFFPGNERLLFFNDRSGPGDLFTIGATGGPLTRLTTHPNLDYDGAISPDGTKIAFVRQDDTGNDDIYVMNADGSGETRLSGNSPQTDDQPVWSPDGAKILFQTTRDNNNEVYIMNADGTSPINLTGAPGVDYNPHFSPDGRQIVFERGIDNGSGVSNQLHVMNADGTSVRNISNDLTYHYFHPAWSPDGTKIAFTRSRIFNDNRGRQVVTEGAGILTMNPDGSGLARITMSPSSDAYPSWSR